MILTTFKFLIIILSISSCLTIKFKLKNEKSILITFLGINLLIYILGLLNIMVFGLYISYILSFLSIVYIIYSIIKKKIDYKKILTLGTILYIVCSLTLAIVLKNTHFSAWDEFSHWGPNLKAMVNNDLFWSNSKWDGIHVVYQPLAGIMEYIFCKLNSGFSEDIAYFGMNISILTFIIPFIALSINPITPLNAAFAPSFMPFHSFEKKPETVFMKVLKAFCIGVITVFLNQLATTLQIDFILFHNVWKNPDIFATIGEKKFTTG